MERRNGKAGKTGGSSVVGIPCDVKRVGHLPFHAVGEKYITALHRCAGLLPILLPVHPRDFDMEAIFSLCDGIFLPGSPSNVHPARYGGAPPPAAMELDEARDACTLPLIRACIEQAVPLFCVCRGFQELNVACGGTLHAHLQDVPSDAGHAARFDHREDKRADLSAQYGPAHDIELTEGGFLASLLSQEAPQRRLRVNSLHSQGIDQPAPAARVEARADDGTIEALHIPAADAFALGVQWHPEWRCWEDAASTRLFAAFGRAVDAHRQGRQNNASGFAGRQRAEKTGGEAIAAAGARAEAKP